MAAHNKAHKQRLVLGLVVIPSLFVAVIMATLYLVLLPAFPIIGQYYFPESSATYALYRTAVWGHIGFGAIALIIGPINLFNALRGKYFKIHRIFGTIYAVSVSASACFALFMSFHAYAGTMPYGQFVATSGFFSLGVAWLVTLYLALYNIIVRGNKNRHFFWMIINISLLYAAVSLRAQVGVLLGTGQFQALYPTLGWLSWLPNLLVGYYFAKRRYDKAMAKPALKPQTAK